MCTQDGLKGYISANEMGKNLIILGLVLVGVGVLWPWLQKIPFGRLPGDIWVKKEGFNFFFPITTCIVISGVVSLILWLMRK